MSSLLPPPTLQAIARKLDMSPRAVERILGSVGIPEARRVAAEKKAQLLNIGLRIVPSELSPFQRVKLREEVGAVISEYRSTCPLVFRWLQRGDFNPRKPPADLTHAQLLHACRTAGRLRATLLRSV